MAQGYDHGANRLRSTVVADPVEEPEARLLGEAFAALGFNMAVLSPSDTASVRADAVLWLAAAGHQSMLEDLIAAARQPIVVATPAAAIDDWSFALGLPGIALVPASDHEGIVRAIGRASARSAAMARESAADDPVQRLRELGAEVARIAQALDVLGGGAAVTDRRPPYRSDAGDGPAVSARSIRAMIRARRLRDQFFAGELFADPAWDILLDLMAARLEGRDVGVSSLCIAAAVPPTTALRWISAMTEQGMLVRVDDADDRRRVFIRLSTDTAERMAACLAALERGGGPVA